MRSIRPFHVAIAGVVLIAVFIAVYLLRDRWSASSAPVNSADTSRTTEKSYIPVKAGQGEKPPPTPQQQKLDREKAAALMADGTPKAQEELVKLFFSAPSDVRLVVERQAAEDLALRKSLVVAAVTALDGAENGPRIAALEALHSLAAPEGQAKAITLLTPESSPAVSQKAVEYLGRMKYAPAFEKACQLALKSENVPLKGTAIRNLPLLGGQEHAEDVFKVLGPSLKDNHSQIQMESLRVLGFFKEGVPAEIQKRVQELSVQAAPKRDGQQQVPEMARMLLQQWEAFKLLPKKDVVSKPIEDGKTPSPGGAAQDGQR